MPRRPQRTRDQWRSLVSDFETSGLSVQEFSRQRDIGYSSFCNWRRVFRQAAPQASAQPEFVELTPVPCATEPGTAPTVAIEWTLKRGDNVQLSGALTAEQLHAVITALRTIPR